jgi:hypothetical protein
MLILYRATRAPIEKNISQQVSLPQPAFLTPGEQNLFWSSAQAIIALHDQRKLNGCPRCNAHGDGCAVLQAAHKRINESLSTPQPT